MTAVPTVLADQGGGKCRPVGRIGGWIGSKNHSGREEILARMKLALGGNGQLLTDLGSESQPAPEKLVADFDCCWVAGRPLANIADWHAVLNGMAEPGNALSRIEGAYAVAWLNGKSECILARDALGERSLFYAEISGSLIFASSVEALLATGLIPRKLSLPAVARYLAYAYVPGRMTMIEGVQEVLPGEMIVWQRGAMGNTAHWVIPSESVTAGSDDIDGARQRLRHELERAVRQRLPTGEPVGATLSGGIDSSLVVALAKKLHTEAIHTFSVTFGNGYANELPFSDMVASHCGTNHHIVEISPQTISDNLDATIRLMNVPNGDPLTVPNAILFREASAFVQVLLNGEGGDPCFGGPKNLPMLLADLLGDAFNDTDELHRREKSYLRAHLKCYDDFEVLLNPAILHQVAQTAPLEPELKAHFDDPRFSSFVQRLSALNVTLKGGHHILPKVDSISAGYGILPRSPLFDRGIVELAFSIPAKMKLMGSVEKYLLKEAVRDLLPAAIIDRPKSGMLVPVEAWFSPASRQRKAGPLLPLARERLLETGILSDIVQRAYLEKLLAGKLGGLRPRHGVKIWLLVTLESWLRSHLV